MKKIIIIPIALLTLLVLSGCGFTFNSFDQVDTAGTGQEFELMLNVSDDGVNTANKTAMIGLRLPDDCSFVRGNVTDSDFWAGSDLTDFQLLIEDSSVLVHVDDLTCPARAGYSWVGLIGDRLEMTGNTPWQIGQIILNCATAGDYELDVAVGVFSENITNYFCNNSFDVLSGQGTPASPFEISTCDNLELMDTDSTAHYQLSNDIDCTGSSFDIVNGSFIGVFDGQGFTISNMNIHEEYSVGMFERIGDGSNIGTVKNLKIENAVVESDYNILGTLAGVSNPANITNIQIINTTVQSGTSDIAGALGTLDGASSYVDNISVTGVVNCYNSADRCGGVIARSSVAVSNLYFSGTMNTVDKYAGGCVGITTASVSKCRVINSTILGGPGTSNYIGGAVGHTVGANDQIYVENVNITGGWIGGAFGYLESGSSASNIIIHNVNVTGNDPLFAYVGGVAGQQDTTLNLSNVLITELTLQGGPTERTGIVFGRKEDSGEVFDVFYNSDEITGYELCGNVSPVPGYCNSTYVHAETTANLQLEATYTNWDFTTVFGINSGEYPQFLFISTPPEAPEAPSSSSSGVDEYKICNTETGECYMPNDPALLSITGQKGSNPFTRLIAWFKDLGWNGGDYP